MKPFCINEKCANFLPEDKRGYYKKTDDTQTKGKKTAKKSSRKTEAGK